MTVEIKVPEMGESIVEATVARWLKQIGEPVRSGEPLVELETDKINLEVGASADGVLARITHEAGDTVQVGDVLGLVENEPAPGPDTGAKPIETTMRQEGVSPTPPPPADSASPDAPASTNQMPGEAAAAVDDEKQRNKMEPMPDAKPETGSFTPVARRFADEMGVDLSQVPASQGGRITKQDVEEYLKGQGGQPAPQAQPEPPSRQASKEPSAPTPYQGGTAPGGTAPAAQPRPAQPQPEGPPPRSGDGDQPAQAGREKRVRMSRRRQTIARRLLEASQSTAMLTTFNEIDMTAVMDLRKRRREQFKERFGVDLGFMPFFIKATVAALKAFPALNAEIQGEEIVYKNYYDIGIAVGADEGLVVPVLRSAEALDFAGIERAIRSFVDKVKTSTLSLEDLRGGTFTITNGGVYGSLLSTPILNPPQVGILGMHRIQERPVVRDGEIVARPMMYVALSYDHRIVDGQEAVQFLVRVKELVEDPESLLMG
jgi:2-oxoglutarate dehydrogenase E2 component (dihydrolipoamide succinyltransferase)